MTKHLATGSVVVCCLSLAAAAWLLVIDPSMTRQEAAAWFQTIGGVLAVLAALAVAKTQEQRADAAERRAELALIEDERRLIDAVIGLAQEPLALVARLGDEAEAAAANPDPSNEFHSGRTLLGLEGAYADAREAIERLLTGRTLPARIALPTTRILREFRTAVGGMRRLSPKAIAGRMRDTEILLREDVSALMRARADLEAR